MTDASLSSDCCANVSAEPRDGAHLQACVGNVLPPAAQTLADTGRRSLRRSTADRSHRPRRSTPEPRSAGSCKGDRSARPQPIPRHWTKPMRGRHKGRAELPCAEATVTEGSGVDGQSNPGPSLISARSITPSDHPHRFPSASDAPLGWGVRTRGRKSSLNDQEAKNSAGRRNRW